MRRNFWSQVRKIVVTVMLSILTVLILENLTQESLFIHLDAYTWESEEFRALDFGEDGLMVIKEFSRDKDLEFYDVLTTVMIAYHLQMPEDIDSSLSVSWFEQTYNQIKNKKSIEYEKLKNAYRLLLGDMECFPVPVNLNKDEAGISYADSWGAERTYGGERQHEGTDIMATNNLRGYFPLVSMTDGTIESIGWLELGGWRIGIRTPKGAYLYYAHMYGYAEELQVGDFVYAGQLLGYMGDTGYSTVEGTTGNFDVHLHVGIYIKTDHYDELSVNPYPILKYMENNRLKSYY